MLPESSDDAAEVALEAFMAFNRKERYHLIRRAVTDGPWSLTEPFRRELEGVLKGDLASPHACRHSVRPCFR